uniref:Zinc finger FYVE-type containing 19 n=1 Tax=Latimeria chalumnae TaxID=7897 RepID=H3B8G0_LATCH
MDRRCYGCASKFSLFKKECGCKNCGRSFCAGCLSQSAVVPRCGNTQQKVCKQCHGELSSGGSQKVASAKWSPPENYKKRVAALEAKQQQQQQRGAQQPSGQKSVPNSVKYRGLAPEDRAIAERLDRLKEETKPTMPPKETNKTSRLKKNIKNKLSTNPSYKSVCNGRKIILSCTNINRTKVLRPPGSQTQTEQAGDLFKQMAEEVAVDQGFTPGEESEETGASAEAPLNDLNRGGVDWQNLNRDDDELDGSLRRLEEEKGKLLAEAMVDLKQDNVRQEQILQVAKRLAVLKGQDPDKVCSQHFSFSNNIKKDFMYYIQSLLAELSEEVAMDEESGFNIRPEPVKPSQTSDAAKPDSSKPEGKAVKARGKPTVTVTKGPAKPTVLAAKKADSDDEELPWCCMCNEDATLRCQGCDGDLYCQRCFREGHDEFDRKEHKTRSYQAPRGQ